MLTREILKLKGSVLYAIAPEDPLVEAVASMVDNDIGSLVVMNHGRLTGMLTFREVLKAVREERSFENRMMKAYIESAPAA